MGKSKGGILSTFTDIFSTADLRERNAEKKHDSKVKASKEASKDGSKEADDILVSGSDVTFGTIMEEDYQAMHAAEDREKQNGTSQVCKKKKKKKPNKLMATLSDIFTTADLDENDSTKSEKKSRRWGKSKKGVARKDVTDVDATTSLAPEVLLEMERNRRIQAEAQMQTILEMNRGMEGHGVGNEDSGILGLHRQLLSLKLKLNREEKRRLEAERREYEAHADLEMCHSALHGAQQEKIQLEAELMEAAADVLEQQALQSACREIQKACQDALKREKEALDAAEKRREDMAIMEERLRISEGEKGRLIEEIARLKIESTRWEEALDRLQDQVDMVLLQDDPLHSKNVEEPKESDFAQKRLSSSSEGSATESYLQRSHSSGRAVRGIEYED